MTIPEFCSAVFAYCHETRASVTSWIRSPERNALVGGLPQSLHLTGFAMDVAYRPNPVPPLMERRRIGRELGLYVYPEGDHDHLRPLCPTDP